MKDKPVPLVIVGGSAGSLKPLQELFSSVHGNCGLAFIVIQHMSPDHESHLDQLIAKRAPLPVNKLQEGMVPLPNQVHVSLPGQFPVLKDAYRYVSNDHTHRPIDRFCESLSVKQARETTLVLLSGSGRDGRNGAMKLKKLNAKVIVQDPATTSFSSMPEAVINEGIADLVLSPVMIGEVLNLLIYPEKFELYMKKNDEKKEDLMVFERILQLVKEDSRLDLNGYKPSTIRRRIQRRMGLQHINDLPQYHHFLLQNSDELEQLSKDLLIGVTAFFRDPDAFKVLEDVVIPSLCENRSEGSPVRIWVAGCSTGEESYSIAILLLQYFSSIEKSPHVQIFATDIDDAALEVARNGVYSKESLVYLDPETLDCYFTEEQDGYRIKKIVRERIVFATHNLISDPPFSKLDMVVCRNLLIYLNAANQNRLLELFHFVLNAGGYLFLGSSENIGSVGEHFDAISKQWRIFSHSDKKPRKSPVLPISSSMVGNRESQINFTASGSQLSQEKYYRQLLESYGPAQLLINRHNQLLYVSGPTELYLNVPTGQASHDLLKIIKPSLSVSLRSAINQAVTENSRVAVFVNVDNNIPEKDSIQIRIEILPIGLEDNQGLFLLTLSPSPADNVAESIRLTEGDDWVLKQLVQEVNATREDLQRTIEQSRIAQEEMRASNEEVMAMNEELQSANEELESSKEELQSLNEELSTSNSNLDAKVTEAEALNLDLVNLMLSTDESIVMVDTELCIRHFTPACVDIMRIISSDIGRNIDDVVRLIPDKDLSNDCRECLNGFRTRDIEFEMGSDTHFLRRLRPYKSSDGKISGVVIRYIDVSEIRQAGKLLNEKATTLEWQSNLLAKAAPIIGRDMNDKIIFWNKGAETLYGWTSQEVINHPVRDILNTEFSTSLDAIRTQLQHKGIWQGEIKHTTRDGKKLILDSQWTIYKDDSGEEVALVEVNNNITERRKFELELDRKEAMFHTMVDWTYNWEFWLSPDRKIIYMTPSVERITGYKPEEFSVTPQLLNLIVHEKDQALWEHLLQWDSAADRQSIKDVRFRILRKNGEQKWIQASCRPVSDDQGQYLGLRVSARDITEQVKAEEQIRTLAYFDSLTGLPNRRLLVDRLSQTLASSSRKKVFSALIFIDLDHFKEINDSQGHVIGDKLLVDVAERIENSVRQMDTVSRQGGDEFVVVLEHLSDDEEHAAARAKEIAEDIRKSLDFSYSSIAGGAEHMNSCSIGITLFNSERENVDLLMKQADLAMYQAKTEGRNAIRFFNPIMQSTIDKRSELVSNIHKGIENNEFRLFFQPQVNCQEQLVAVEGLVRWVRPEAGIATPNEFISLCEQTGLILQLGEIVLEQGMQQLKEWERIEKFKNLNISLNVSPRQFLQPDFVKSITEKIQRIGCNPNLLTLEITENLVLKSVSDVALQMDQLRKLGISFSLDDFGTGYSSLDKLKKLPFSQLKIDKSFVRDLCVDNSDKAIINAMLAMGKSFGLEIVAEGVENSAQAKYFIDNNCDKLQGYLYSKALSIEDFMHEYL